MTKTITVKGIGNARVKPDYVVIMIYIDSHNKNYNRTIKNAARKIESLQEAVCEAGFEKSDLKTINFDVTTDYHHEEDRDGNGRRVFDGYVCSYTLRLSFDFDNQRLADTLTAIAGCDVDPDLDIGFTVKDPSVIRETLLRNAAENARKKAEILCAAANVKLGDLIHINYNWSEFKIQSRTSYKSVSRPVMLASKAGMPDITPDDIDANDTVAFIWEIL